MEGILERPIAIDVKDTFEADRLQPWSGCQNPRRQCRKLVVVATVERQLHNLPLINHRPPARSIDFQERRFGRDGHFLGDFTNRQLDIESSRLIDLKS